MASPSFLRGGLAARCVHNSPAIGGRIPHLRAEKCKFQRTRPRAASLAALRQFTFCRWNLRLKFICRRARRPGQPLAALLLYGCRVPLAGKKSATLCRRARRGESVFCPQGRKCGGCETEVGASIFSAEGLFTAGGSECGTGGIFPVCRRRRQMRREKLQLVAVHCFCGDKVVF